MTITRNLREKRVLVLSFFIAVFLSSNVFARNVILIVGDGMDDQQLTIARNYLKGAQGRLLIDSLPVRSISQVLTVRDDNPSQQVYVADSANSATAMASGVATSRGRIGTSAGNDKDLPNLVELAKRAGLKTGIVSTASITDATPASFYAHVSSRGCESPVMMHEAEGRGGIIIDCSQDMIARGGPGSIAEQVISSGVDIILGGGFKHFAVKAEGSEQTVAEQIQAAGYTLIKDKAALLTIGASNDDHLTSENTTDHTKTGANKIVGLFSDSTMPVRLRGEGDRSAEKPDPSIMNQIHWSQGEVELPEAMSCEPNPEFSSVPSLQAMTDLALSQLQNDAGFFLMIESASIDKQSHQRKACGSIGEVEQLDEALASALKFAETHPDTLILVTADHGQAAQIVPDESLYSIFGVPVFTPGKLFRIRTPEGSIMAVNYATNDFFVEEHTGVSVPLLGNKEAVGIVPSMVTQPEIFTLIKRYLSL